MSEVFQQEAQAEQKMALLEFSSFRGLILPANQLSSNDKTLHPLRQFRVVPQQKVSLWSYYAPPERFIFLLFGLCASAGCFSIGLMRTAVWYVIGVLKLQPYIFITPA